MAQRIETLRRGSSGALFWGAILALCVVVGYLSQRSPTQTVALLGLIVVGVLVLQRNVPALVSAAMLGLAWGYSVLPGSEVAFYAKFGLIAALGATVVAGLVARTEQHLPIPTGFGVASFGLLLVALLSSAWSVDASDSIQKAVSMLLLWAAAVIAIPSWTSGERDVRRLYLWMGVTAAAFTGLGLVFGLAGIVDGFRDGGRFNGFLGAANTLGFWVAPILPALVMLAAKSEPGRRRRLLIGAVAVLSLGVVLSGSRGGSVAVAAGIVAGFLAAGVAGQIRQARRAIALVLVAIGVVTVMMPLLGLHLRDETTSGGEGLFELGTGSNRTPAWQVAIRVANEAPLIGHGLGATPILFPNVQSITGEQNQILGRTHNSYLEAAIDLGWPGMLWLLGLGCSGVLAAWRVARKPGPWQAVAIALLVAIVGGMVEGVFESGLLAAGGLLALPFWIAVALAHSVRLADRAGEPTQPSAQPIAAR
jgi:O-antigen ligase